jgi:hypothetical protein
MSLAVAIQNSTNTTADVTNIRRQVRAVQRLVFRPPRILPSLNGSCYPRLPIERRLMRGSDLVGYYEYE